MSESAESEIVTWMALRKDRNHWGRKLRRALENKDPPESIQILKNRIEAIDDAMKKYEH